MDAIDVDDMQKALIHVANAIVDSEDRLTKIDSVIGDGDHGIGMRIGFGAVRDLLNASRYDSMNALFKAVGMELVKTMGGASGVLFGSLFIGGLQDLPETRSLTVDQLADFFVTSVDSICRRGKASPGDKTMVDALLPGVQALRRAADSGGDVEAALSAAAAAAEEGMEATKGMLSRIGRARNFGESTLGHPDAGAVSSSILFRSLCDYFCAAGAS